MEKVNKFLSSWGGQLLNTCVILYVCCLSPVFFFYVDILLFCTAHKFTLRVQIKKPELDYNTKTKPHQTKCFNAHVNMNIMKKNIKVMKEWIHLKYLLTFCTEARKDFKMNAFPFLYSLKNRFIFWGPIRNCQCLIFLDIVLLISRQVGKLCNWADVTQPKRESGEGRSQRSRWNRGISGGFFFTSAA